MSSQQKPTALSDDSLLFDSSGPVATITFNRPDKANAMGPDWIGRMIAFLREVEHKPSVRCVLFRGEGKHFQAGADVSHLAKVLDEPELHKRLSWFRDTISEGNLLARTILTLPKPVVASVQGGAIGGAFTIIAACDLVIASEDAFFSVGQIINGYSMDGMPSYFLPRLIGHRKTAEWALLGSRVTAQEAKDLGFINFVAPLDKLAEETDLLVARLATGPTKAYAINKALLYRTWQHSFEEQADFEVDLYMGGAASEDWAEGTRAFLERRKPVFKGR